MRLNKMQLQPILERNTLVYNDYYKEGVIDGWEQDDKLFNFSHLTSIEMLTQKPLKNASVLDVGCGSGDFFPFLQRCGIKSYVGVDIYPPALALAKQKYPQATFINMDILDTNYKKRFDYIFCSGALSLRLETIDNYDFFSQMVRVMYRLSKKGVAFNILSDEDKDPDAHLFYYQMDKIKQICQSINPKGKVLTKKTPIPTEGRLDNIQYHVFLY